MPRTKPHFKVHLSLGNHRKTASVYSDNDLLALYVRLGMAAVERFADRTHETFIVQDRELNRLTGFGRADVSRTSLRRLADVSPISAERDGQVWRITFPNFRRKQGFAPRNGAGMVASPSPTPSPTPTKNQRGGPVRPPSTPETLFPLDAKEEIRAKLTDWAARKGYTDSVLIFAIDHVANWSHTRRKRRARWDMVVQNHMNKGWALPENAPRGPASTRRAAAEVYQRRFGGME